MRKRHGFSVPSASDRFDFLRDATASVCPICCRFIAASDLSEDGHTFFRTGRTAACYNTQLQKINRTALTQKVKQADAQQAQTRLHSRRDEVYAALDALQNYPLSYDDYLIRQTLSRVIAVF